MLKPTDVDHLIKLLEASEFQEMRLDVNGTKIHLKRKGGLSTTIPEEMPASAPSTTFSAPKPASPAAPAAHGTPVPAPMLGTFWHAPRPGDPPFVEVGSKVKPDTLIGIIEVMKLMNTVLAGVAGTVTEVSAPNGKGVEFGQVLIRVDTGA